YQSRLFIPRKSIKVFMVPPMVCNYKFWRITLKRIRDKTNNLLIMAKIISYNSNSKVDVFVLELTYSSNLYIVKPIVLNVIHPKCNTLTRLYRICLVYNPN